MMKKKQKYHLVVYNDDMEQNNNDLILCCCESCTEFLFGIDAYSDDDDDWERMNLWNGRNK